MIFLINDIKKYKDKNSYKLKYNQNFNNSKIIVDMIL